MAHPDGSARFASELLALHRTIAPGPDYAVPMCTCGRPAVRCDVLAAGRDTGLLPPLGTPPAVADERGLFR